MKKYLICKKCGNLVEMIEDSGVPIVCCGTEMSELIANEHEGTAEKHIPVIIEKNNIVTIKIGSIEHPMEENHYIKWVSINTTKGKYNFSLEPNMEPKVEFSLSNNEKVIDAYAYCNIHGLWKKNN